MITIVEYGLGNVRAFWNVYRQLNVEVKLAKTAVDLQGAEKLILPGVGQFDHAMRRLQGCGMLETLEGLVVRQRVPVLGVCVGMQILARSSDEGELPGLGWIDGHVRKFEPVGSSDELLIPHMGWNEVQASLNASLFNQMNEQPRFYFLHSYYFQCDRPEDVAANCVYGVEFNCAVNRDNVYGVQFHPEKSHRCGTQLLKNFAEL